VTDEEIRSAAEANGWHLYPTARALGRNPTGAFRTRLARIREAAPVPAPRSAGAFSSPPPPPEPEPEAPAWQGYRPRAAWTEPEKTKAPKAAKTEVVRTIVTADWHEPYVERKSFACMLGIIREVKPHRIILNGDGMDMESLSRHPKSRPDLAKLAEEYYAQNLALDEWQNAAPDAEAYYVEGNHESRASRFAAEMGQLDGMLDVPGSLYITPRAEYHRETVKLRGMHWIPLSMQPFAIGAVGYLHGVFESIYHSAMTAQHLGPKCGMRVLVTAHLHGWQSFASPSGFVAYSCPCLADETAAVFRAYMKGRPRPHHLGGLYIEEAGDVVTVTPILVSGGRALFGGRLVRAA
jgi:hypothetical protein